MGKRVAQLVRVQVVAQTGLPPPLADVIWPAPLSVNRPFRPSPSHSHSHSQGRFAAEWRARQAKVSIERLCRLGADRDDPPPSALPDDAQEAPVEIDVVRGIVDQREPQVRHLRAPRARVDEDADQCRVPVKRRTPCPARRLRPGA